MSQVRTLDARKCSLSARKTVRGPAIADKRSAIRSVALAVVYIAGFFFLLFRKTCISRY